MSGPWEAFSAAATGQRDGPWTQFAKRDFGIDWSRPREDVRAAVAQLPAADREEALRQWADSFVEQERKTSLGVDDGVRAIARGTFVGPFLDEITAGTQGALHAVSGGMAGAPYDEAVAYQRARDRSFDKENPVASFALQVGGGLAGGGAAIKAGGAAGAALGGPVSGLAPAPTALGRAGQASLVGAGYGASAGFGNAEGGAPERLAGAQSGAATGAVLGPVLQGAVSAGTRLVGAAADRISPAITRLRDGPEVAAEAIIARRIAEEGSSPAAKRLDLQRGQGTDARMGANSSATLPETLADTSDAMRRLTGSIYRAGGEAGNLVSDTLQRRQRGPDNALARGAQANGPDGQMARVMDATERALQIRSAGSAHRTEQQMMARQAEEGRRLYDAARQNSEAFDLHPAMDALALTAQQYPGPFRARLLRALSLFRDDTPNRMPVSNIARFDASKKALDDMIEASQRQGQGNLTRELTGFKNALLDAVHRPDQSGIPTANLAYHNARQAWGSAAENRQAIDLGRQALNEASEVTVDQFRSLTRGQQQLFRLGFLDSLRGAMATKKPGNDVTQIFQQQRVQELLREIIPRSRGTNGFSNRPERFGNYLNREQRMVQTRNDVLGGSPTAQRQQDDMGFAGDALSSMWSRFRSAPSLFNVGVEAIGTGIQKVFGYRQDVALAMARRLLESDPQRRNEMLRRLQQRHGSDAFAQMATALDQAGMAVAGTMSAQSARGDR